MDPLITLLLIAAGPIIAVFTDFSDDTPAEDDPATDDPATDDPATDDPATDDPATDDPATDDPATGSSTAPESAVADARDASDVVNITDNVARGTDADEQMQGETDASNVFDASGGTDTVIGGTGADTLIGGEGSDSITGGDGDDAVFGGHVRGTRADDMDADTIDGGAGDDVLVIGDGDTAIGGLGADIFAVVQDATGNATITDFDTDLDALIIESADAEALEITDQEIDADGLTVTLNTGMTLSLLGLEAELDETAINFVTVEALEVLTDT